jgi:hypothetical protein
MELDEPSIDFPKAPEDKRLKMPEPPPVHVVAVEDVTLESSVEDVARLDEFYINLLKFERDTNTDRIVYKAENVRLQFVLLSPAEVRDDMRALGIEVPSLADLELVLIDAKVPFTKERTLMLGHTTFLLRDPAGNWLRIGQVKRIL